MIAQSQNKALLYVAERAAVKPDWRFFAEYCRLREEGLRKKSFEKLSLFLQDYQDFSFAQKKEFANFIFDLAENIEDADYGPLPHQLQLELKNTLVTWTEKETKNTNPFRWLGKFFRKYEFVEKALEINSSDDKARVFLIERIIYDTICHSTHHLPDYYIGDPKDDLESADLAESYIEKLTDISTKEFWLSELDASLKLVKSYINWVESNSNLDFKTWGEANNRHFDSGIKAYYYDEE